MASSAQRNFTFDTIDSLTRLTSPAQVCDVLVGAMANFGFTSLGINGLPPPDDGADPIILTESAPDGFRDLYHHERFYQVDHICAHARTAAEPFRFSEASYRTAEACTHARFMQTLDSYGMSQGIVVPIGSPAYIPACVWLAGENPDLQEEAVRATQLISLFAAGKAHALARPRHNGNPRLTAREREVLAWAAQGKSAWEIGQILRIAKRTADEHTQTATRKLGAANKTQAVVQALLRHLIEP